MLDLGQVFLVRDFIFNYLLRNTTIFSPIPSGVAKKCINVEKIRINAPRVLDRAGQKDQIGKVAFDRFVKM